MLIHGSGFLIQARRLSAKYSTDAMCVDLKRIIALTTPPRAFVKYNNYL
jgi:hypothetical protein